MLPFVQDHWFNLIVATVAVWGAALSTFTFFQNRRKEQRAMRVTMTYGFLSDAHDLGEQMIFVTAGNIGEKKIRVLGLAIKFPGQLTIIPRPRPGLPVLPCDLEPGTSCDAMVELKSVREAAIEKGFRGSVAIRPFAVDGLGRHVHGKRSKLSLKG